MKKITLFFSLLAMMIVGLQAQAADDVYTICGSSAALFGNTWDPTNTDNDMTLLDDGSYQLLKENVTLTLGDIQYKVTDGHAWGGFELPSDGGNQILKITSAGIYNVTFTLNSDKNELTAVAQLVEDQPEDPIEIVYTIVGDASLLGANWDTNAAANEMVKQEDGTYKLVKNNVTLADGKYSYKVVGNHDYGVFEYPLGMNNNTISIDKSGEYNVTFTLKLEGPELSAEVELIKEEVIEFESYTVAGVEALMGADWDVNAEANDMTKQEDGTYTLVKENVELAAGTYDYKVVANHSWGVWELPSSGNQTLAIEKAGKYNVTFTLDITKPELTANAVLIEVVPEPVVDYLLHYGTASSDWQDVTFVAGEGENEGKLVATATFAENTEFGIKHGDTWYAGLVEQGDNYIIKYDWCTNIPLNSEGNIKNFLIAEAGTYTFVLTVGEEGITMDVQGLVEPQTEYVLNYGHDGENDWQNATFVVGEGTYEGKLVAKDVEFTAVKTQFGVKYGDIWYAGLPNAGEGLYWIHDTWCTNIPLSTGDGVKNFIINEIGTYTFVLTVGENGITMDVEGFPVAPVLGDLNGDGKADVTDVNIIVNMILGKQEKTAAGNLNGDDDVDVTDVNLLVNIILGKSGDTTGEGE